MLTESPSLVFGPLVELFEMVYSKSVCVLDEFSLQGFVTHFLSGELAEQNVASCGGFNMACALQKQRHYALSFVLAYLSVFQRHSEVLETSVLLDENN